MKNPEVFIGIPSTESWTADFGMSLAGLVASIGRPLKNGGRIERVQLWNTKGSILPRSRETLVLKAIELKCSHILFLDSDQTFPNWALHQLLSWDKDVVAANIATKTLPALPTARQKNSVKTAGKLVYSGDSAKGLEEVWRIGTGVMLLNLRIFEKIPQPRFPIVWNPAIEDHTGEDWTFCEKLQEQNIPIYIDHDLSKHIGHVGVFTYGHQHIEQPEGGV
jgi:hypothetical protein